MLVDGHGHFSIEALVISERIRALASLAPMNAPPALTVHREARLAVELFDEAVMLSS